MPLFLSSGWLPASIGGASFSLMGISYRLGRPRRVPTENVALAIGVAGVVFFGARAGLDALTDAPWFIWALGLTLGVTQYGVVKAIQAALAHGPLSPIWCTVSLHFVPVIVFAHFAFDESMGTLRAFGLATGALCVLLGSLQQRADASPEVAGRHIRWSAYLGLLLTIFLLNSLPPTSVKALAENTLADGRTMMDAFGDTLYIGLYAGFAAALAVDRLMARTRVPWRPWLACGAVGAAGSIGGMSLMALCAPHNATVVFTTMSTVSILVTATVSVVFFRERVTAAWVGMLLAGVLALALLAG